MAKKYPIDVIIVAIWLVIWWSILNYASGLKWWVCDNYLFPANNTTKEVFTALSAALFIWRIALTEWVVPTPRQLACSPSFA